MGRKLVGIQFYGKRRQHRYFGACPACHGSGVLSSYQTQRWFGISALPLLPMGARQIVHHCELCDQFLEYNPEHWEVQRVESLKAAAADMKTTADSPKPVIRLYSLLSASGQKEEANELLSLLKERFGENEEAQACLRAAESIDAPVDEGSQGYRRFAAVVFTLLLFGFLILNAFVARYHTAHIVNGWPTNVTVSIDGQDPIEVGSLKAVPFHVSEGSHTATVSGAVTSTIPFEVNSTLAERWLGGRFFVINPGGGAMLLTESTLPHPNAIAPDELDYTLHVGVEYLQGEADYIFTDFPDPTPIASTTPKRRVALVAEAPEALFHSLNAKKRFEESMKVAEWRLDTNPGMANLLGAYVNVAMVSGQYTRMKGYLSEGLARRPVLPQWHRIYQSLDPGQQGQKRMIEEYDRHLAESPNDSDLLYLRGRLSSQRKSANPYYEKAIEVDPANAFAHHALGYNAASAGDWAKARPHLQQASLLRPADEAMQELYFLARFALGELPQLATELEDNLKKDPLQLTSIRRLGEVLLTQNDYSKFSEMLEQHHSILTSRFTQQANVIQAQLLTHMAYVKGEFNAMIKLAATDRSLDGRQNLFNALTELGRFQEATNAFPLMRLQEPFHVIAFALAEDSAKQTLSAVNHLRLGSQRLLAGHAGYIAAAGLLAKPKAPTLEEVRELILAPQTKAVLLLALAQRFPESRETFHAEANRLNISREFPHHLIKRLTQAKP